jgi:acetyl-CoA acetyltransferase
LALDPTFAGADERGASSRAFRVAGPKAFAEAGYGLEDLGFVPRGEAVALIAEGNTAPDVSGTAR